VKDKQNTKWSINMTDEEAQQYIEYKMSKMDDKMKRKIDNLDEAIKIKEHDAPIDWGLVILWFIGLGVIGLLVFIMYQGV